MRFKFIILVLVQIFILTGIIIYREHWIKTGTKVILKTAPVDPRDIFRGDYLSLRYHISSLDLDRFNVKEDFKKKERVYVSLEKSDDIWRPVSVTKTIPSQGIFIQGKVRSFSESSRWEITVQDEAGQIVNLSIGYSPGLRKEDHVLFCIDSERNVLIFFKDLEKTCFSGAPLQGIVEDVNTINFRRLDIAYGIEKYFVEEGVGRGIEGQRELRAEVSLRRDGRPIITGLYMDGRMIR